MVLLGDQVWGASVPGVRRLVGVGQNRIFTYRRILDNELLQAGGMGGSAQAELGHRGERVVLLDNQVRGAAVPRENHPGETGQPECKGGAAPMEVLVGGRCLRR